MTSTKEAPMFTLDRDRQPLRLRAPDQRPVAEAAAVILRELARPVRAASWDVHLSDADRRLMSFRERYGALAERPDVSLPVLWAAAHGHGHPGARSTRRPCGWDMARIYARRHGLAIPRLTSLGLAVLGPPCVGCRAVVDPQPKAKPKAKATVKSVRSAARSTSARTTAWSSTPARTRRPSRADLVAATQAGLTAAAIAYNRSRVDTLNIPRHQASHLTAGVVW
jgi:hypothetical protein